MILMGRVAGGEMGEEARRCFFIDGTCQLQPLPASRKVGRPRQTWMQTIHESCLQAAGGQQNLENVMATGQAWKAVVHRYVSSSI